MAFPVTSLIDDFNRANAASLGAGWSDMPSPGLPTHEIVSNQAAPPAGGFSCNYRTTIVAADQEVWATFPVIPSLGAGRLLGRIQNPNTGSESAYYITIFDSQDWYLEKSVASGLGSAVTLQTLGSAGDFQAGWKVGMSIVGTTIKCYKNTGGGWAQVGTDQTDSSVTGAGYIGFETANNTNTRWEDFGGGASGQTLLPDADVAAGGWTTSPLFSKVNDSSDATIITATAS